MYPHKKKVGCKKIDWPKRYLIIVNQIVIVHMINKNYNVFFYIRHLPMSNEILNNPVDGLSKVLFF